MNYNNFYTSSQKAKKRILGEGKDNTKYYPFSHIELWIPWIFGILGLMVNSGGRKPEIMAYFRYKMNLIYN